MGRWPYSQIGVATTRVFRNLMNTILTNIGLDMQDHASRSDNLQAQIDNMVAEGDSSPAAAQAAVGADGTTYASLKTRLDTEYNQGTSRTASMETKRIQQEINDFSAGFKGLSIRNYTKGNFYTDRFRTTAIQYVQRMGANTIAVIFNAYQTATNTADVDYLPESDPNRWWTTYQEVYDYVKFLKSLGYKVMLKPHVEPESDARDPSATGYIPRDRIRPDDPATWFTNYQNFLIPYVQMCEELHVDILSIGCEYKGLTELKDPDTQIVKDYTQYWINLIQAIRAVYHGLLTYSAYYTTNYWDEPHWIKFWDYLDIIGLDYYINRAHASLVTQSDYDTAIYDAPDHSNCVLSVEYLQEKYKKPVIFTEMGNALNTTTPVTTSMQANWAQSVLKVFTRKEYFKGCFWWEFTSDTDMTDSELPSDNNDLWNIFNQYYQVIGNGNQKNKGLYITPKNNNADVIWFNFASINFLKNQAAMGCRFYFEDLLVNEYPHLKGYVDFKAGSTTGTSYDQLNLMVAPESNLDPTAFGYVVNGSQIDLYIRIDQYKQFVYRLAETDGKRGLVQMQLFNIYNQGTASPATAPTAAVQNRFYHASELQTVAYEGNMSNGVLETVITLPFSVPYQAFVGANVKSVNSDSPENITANVSYVSATQVKLCARHYTGAGNYYAQYQILIVTFTS